MVGRNDANDLGSLGRLGVDHGTAAYAIDSDTVYEVSVSWFLPCADVTAEEAKGSGFDTREPEPAHFIASGDRSIGWKEFYKFAWDIKVRVLDKQHCRIAVVINKDYAFVVLIEADLASVVMSNTDGLLPFFGSSNHMCCCGNSIRPIITKTHEASAVTIGRLDFDDERRDGLNDGLPVHCERSCEA